MIPSVIRILFLVSVVLMLRVTAIADRQEFPCKPSVDIEKALNFSTNKEYQALDYEKRVQKRREILQELLQKYPEDIFVHQAYQNFLQRTSDPGYDKIVEGYRKRMEADPENPALVYLYAHALKDQEKQIEYFTRIINKGVVFPLVYESLSSIYVWDKPDKEKLKDILKKWLAVCPDAFAAYEYIRDIRDAEFVRPLGIQLRKTLRTRHDLPEVTQHYSVLWSLEFASSPPSEHGVVRKNVSEDLQKLWLSPGAQTLDGLYVIKEGYETLGAESGVRRTEDRILQLFPNTEDAAEIIMDRWEKQHPEPDAADGTAMKKWIGDNLRVTEEWVKRWPDLHYARQRRLDAMHGVEDLTPDVVLKAVDAVLDHEEKGSYSTYPPEEFKVAHILIDNRLRLDQVENLIVKGLKSVEDQSSSHSYTDVDGVKQDAQWRADALRVRVSLARDRVEDANPPLTRLKEMLAMQRKEEDFETWAEREGEYWELLAQRSLKNGNRADALLNYQTAVTATPQNQKRTAKARDLWKELGGSDSGWDNFLVSKQKPVDYGTVKKNLPFPEFRLTDFAGKAWGLSDLKGRIVFINVWATWCGPCLIELPHVEKLYQKVKDKDGLLLITLNLDENVGLVEPFLKKNGYTFPVMPATDLIEKIEPEWGIPINWILDKESVITKEVVGFDREKANVWSENMYGILTSLLKD